MSLTSRLMVASALALAAFTTGCTKQTGAAAPPPPSTVSDDYKRKLAAVAQKMAAQDRTDTLAKRQAMARLIDARVVRTADDDRSFSFQLQLKNKSSKPIKTIGAGLEVHDAAGKRIGLMEIDDAPIRIAANGTLTTWLHEPYVRFGENAGTMRLAQGKAKRIAVNIIEIKYTDGSDAGYDD